METQILLNNLIKYLEILFVRIDIKFSKKLKKKISNSCLKYLDKIFIESGNFCEEKHKTTLSEEDFLFILDKLELKRYKNEISEEKKRIYNENFGLEKFYS